MNGPARLIVASVLAALGLLAGCMPTSVTLNFGESEGKLRESTVASEGAGGAKVALIDVRGLIIDGPTPGLFTSGRNPVAELVTRLRQAETDPDVKAVVLRVNSPGGGVGATETMYNEVVRFRERTKKPVVVHLADIAASGGYYLALAGDRIIASPSGITGSIGVIIPTFNFADGMKRVGVVSRSVKSKPNKDLANPFEPMRDSQYTVLQSMVDGMYAVFRARVVERRGAALDSSRLDELTDGRTMLGLEAVKAGLADETGDVYDAFARARELAGLSEAALIVYYRGGSARPTTPYAGAEMPELLPEGFRSAAGTGPGEVNLLKVDLSPVLGGAGSESHLTTGGAYYLWVAGW